MQKYRLELTQKQLEILLPAIDLAGRIHLGQISEVANYCNHHTNHRKADFYYGREALEAFKKMVMPEDFGGNTAYGIHNEAVSDSARVLFDIHDVIRNRLAWDGLPPGATSKDTIYVQFDKPSHYGPEPLPVIEKISGGRKLAVPVGNNKENDKLRAFVEKYGIGMEAKNEAAYPHRNSTVHDPEACQGFDKIYGIPIWPVASEDACVVLEYMYFIRIDKLTFVAWCYRMGLDDSLVTSLEEYKKAATYETNLKEFLRGDLYKEFLQCFD